MQETICLQCKASCFSPINRLVQDACGHKKCRTCLLADEQRCAQCEVENCQQNGLECISKIVNLECDRNGEITEVVPSNHTGVIQVNGECVKVKKDVSFACNDISEDEQFEKVITETFVKTHTDNSEEFNVNIHNKCKKKTHNPVDIPKHIIINSDPVSYHCTICNKIFVTKTHVKYHSYCAGVAKPFKCEVCQKEFILRAQLDVHSYKHKSNKPFTCAICKKSFSARNKLTRHATVHSTVKSHICSICGNAYRSKESLKIHSVIHKGEKPYSCKLCPAKFNNQSNLSKHILTHSSKEIFYT